MAQAQLTNKDRVPVGNDLYGAFGRDFATKDDRRIMVVAISKRQWQSLVEATNIVDHLTAIEDALGVDLSREGDRWDARDAIASFMAPFIATHNLNEIAEIFIKWATPNHALNPYDPYFTTLNFLNDCFDICDGTNIDSDCGCIGPEAGNEGDGDWCDDCAGVPNGTAYEDECDVCDDDPSNDCVQDCAGVWGGSAEEETYYQDTDDDGLGFGSGQSYCEDDVPDGGVLC